MNVSVVTEARFDRAPDGTVWTGGGSYKLFKRYLEVFDGVTVVARLRDVLEPLPGAGRASGPGVQFARVPYYLGPWQYVLSARRIGAAVRDSVAPRDAVILRLGSLLAASVDTPLHRRRRPYGVELTGDPYEVFAPGVVRHPLRPFLRWWFTKKTKTQCARAVGVAYVTRAALQTRYPCGAYSVGVSDVELKRADDHGLVPGVATFYSSVDLGPSDFATQPRQPVLDVPPRVLIIGSLAQMYKGVDVLLEAVAICRDRGQDLQIRVVGDGRYRATLEQEAARRGVADRVTFIGFLSPGEPIRHELDQATVFVLPSRTEGLPRAMLEAMARGVPCIGSAVGGIPELLGDSELVPPGNARALAEAIQALVNDPARLARLSSRNLEVSLGYEASILQERRRTFYRHLRRVTEAWLAKGRP